MLHAYGNVKASQGKFDESFEFHSRGLQQYKSTIGNHHHRTGDLCVKVSGHLIRAGQYESAKYEAPVLLKRGHRFRVRNADRSRSLLDQALKIYGDREYYGPERARALFKKGKLLQNFGKESSQSQSYLTEALDLYRKLKKERADFRRGIDELTEMDFDDLIVFWSK